MAADSNQDENFNNMLKDSWRKRVNIPEDVLDVLHVQHTNTLTALFESMKDTSVEALEGQLEGLIASSTSDWYTQPAKKTCEAINKLSEGSAMDQSQLAVFFDDIYIGSDLKEVLMNPEQPPESYPNTIVFSSMYFLREASQYIEKEFWDQNTDLSTAHSNFDLVGMFPATEQNMSGESALTCLSHAQRLTRIMPLVADELKALGYANLATIANCFASKGQAMSDDIIAKTEAAIANKQEPKIVTKYKAPGSNLH